MGSLLGAWYRTGTVSVINGNNLVVGVGTKWKSALIAVVAGDIFTVDNHTWYEVIDVDLDTNLHLDRDFEGVSASDIKYAVIRSTSGTVLTSVAGQIALQFNQKQVLLDEIRTWLNSTNQTENITDSHGQTFALTTPSQMALEHAQRISDVDDLVTQAVDATAVQVLLLSDNGIFFRNNTGNVKTITATIYINGVLSTEHANYKYKWLDNGVVVQVSATGDYVSTTPAADLYPADGDDISGLNFQSIKVDFTDVEFDTDLNLTCEVSNI